VTLQSRPKNEYFKTKKKAMGLFSKKASSKSQEAPSEPSVPQLMTRKAMAAAEPEAIVAILIDNPTSMEAIPPMCPEIDASYLDTLKEDRGWRVILKKNS
jgi:TusA-related sulfurtransferase